jgi:hypothetical protein
MRCDCERDFVVDIILIFCTKLSSMC